MSARRSVWAALAFAAWLPAQAPVLGDGEPGSVGMSAAVLRAGSELFAEAVARNELCGAVVLVARRGRIVLHEAFGVRDVAGALPMQRDSLFRLASNTKPVVATAVLQLVERGKLGLDDVVRRHLPSFDNHRAGWITVRQLLSHTSGLRIEPIFLMPLLGPSPEHPDAPSLRAEVDRFGTIGAAVAPGTTYSYSNAGYNTLGALVEVASGLDLADQLRLAIYEPLGMTDTCNHESAANPERMSAVFRRQPDGTWRAGWQPGDPPDYPFVRASGGMISTARDYAVFLQALLQGGAYGDVHILSAESVRAMTTPETARLRAPDGRAAPAELYGLGLGVHPDGSYSHAGSDGTWAWVDPRRELVGVVFTQCQNGGNPRAQFRAVVEASCRDVR
ncbi:MAG: beta-lactamase family protein [Planctomycetes bacterium]|nr:beta-lactamase family protein [Planctomycetota bacterium]